MSEKSASEQRPTRENPQVTLTPETEVTENDTERTAFRKAENAVYVPVIIKRTDETFRHPDDILEKAIDEGVEQHARPDFSLFLSSVAAGMILCFTVLAVGVMATLTDDPGSSFGRVATACVYPLGFVLVILSRTQLFTEHTATAVYPVLDSRASVRSLLRLWAIVGSGNLAGGLIGASMLVAAEDVVGARDGYLYLADHINSFSLAIIFTSAILAGWLMALGAWVVLGTHSGPSQILSIYIVTFVIGLGGLHHSIAGSLELMAAWLSSTEADFWRLPPVIAVMFFGNMIGGSVFVAVLNYGHIRQSQRLKNISTNAPKDRGRVRRSD